MAEDLFGAAAEERLSGRAPLADRLRPRRLDDIVGQDHLLGAGRPLRVLIEADRLSSVILWGPPGTGKTTLARVIAGHTAKAFETLSAVTAGVKDVREVVARAQHRLGERGQGTILFLDEVHRFNKSQQDALLPSVESGLLTLVGATTENPYFEVNPPLLSRSTLFRLVALDDAAARQLIDRALEAEGAEADDDAIGHLASRANGDGRHTLTSLEVAVALARGRRNEGEAAGPNEPPLVTLADAEAALGTKAIRYGRDDHYDVVSAFIKSIRGSDADAGLYWLATMLEAGEDARFIVRRLIILASEDVGEADPTSLLVAVAAAHALEHVGLPEAQLNLAQAVVHLANAPKSNRSALGIWGAREDVRQTPSSGVPAHLRDGHYQGAAKLGHGDGYAYPHDDPRGWVPQSYLPPEVADRRYYTPSAHGHEGEVAARMAGSRRTEASDTEPGPPPASGLRSGSGQDPS
ncbi:MAG: replication-associated recombination protein A, partial [Aquihabitans sp.]